MIFTCDLVKGSTCSKEFSITKGVKELKIINVQKGIQHLRLIVRTKQGIVLRIYKVTNGKQGYIVKNGDFFHLEYDILRRESKFEWMQINPKSKDL